MNASDQQNVPNLRKLIDDVQGSKILTDFDLLRWLKQYNDNLDAVIPKLRHRIKMMESWDVENYNRHPIMKKYWPTGLLDSTGVDDNLLYIEANGCVDTQGLLKSVPLSKIMMSHIAYLQQVCIPKLHQLEQSTGRLARFVVILDFEHLKFDRAMISFVITHYKAFGEFITGNYGDVYEKFVLVNVPKNIYNVYKFVKPFLPERAHGKTIILGPNWKTEILKHATVEALPVHWGGAMVDPDGDQKCPSRVYVPPRKIPESLYFVNIPTNVPIGQLNQISVPARRVKFVDVEVKSSGSTLEWYFTTNNKFGFGVYFTEDAQETNADNMQMVFPDLLIYQSGTVIPEQDKIICRQPGYYKLRFDNTHSWFHALKVQYYLTCHERS